MSMSALSSSPAEKARKAHSRVLSRLQEVGTARTAAQVMGVSETTVSRIKTEHLEGAIALLYTLGMKVVDADRICVDPEYLKALQTMARYQAMNPAPTLDWEN